MKLYDVQVNIYAGYKADKGHWTLHLKKTFLEDIKRIFTVKTDEGSTL
jgi:hypothetical protein